MLMQRVITALLLLPVLLALIWFTPTPWLYLVLSAVGLQIAWEWSGLMSMTAQRSLRLAYVAAAGGVLAIVWWMPTQYRLLLWGAATLWWLVAISLLPGFPENLQRHPIPKLVMALVGLLLIAATLIALVSLHAQTNGALKLLFLLFLIFAADTGAYLAGRNFGKHKLAPNVSPGKTIEGAIGGLLLCAAWGLIAGAAVFQVNDQALLSLVLLSLLVAALSIVGDLTESMFKRVAGLKDSGNILPGHGGILDRVDSLLAAAPAMILGLSLLKL
jgi:phosphatidate cytidylyltransferase